ncbi:MAG TPA: hypothetical protein VJP84_00270 [Steroidobacteraceae bacterium]|jgi:hypothetical protein|nr:hypothetical protein [Steroidobacteraceae bacterium]
MDALRIERVMLRTLLIAQPRRAVFCVIIALAGAAAPWLEPGPFRDILAPAMIGLASATFLAIAATRLDACCHSAGALGMPRHLEHVHRTQAMLLCLCVALPAIYLLAMGFGWFALSVSFGAGATGVHLLRNPVLPLLVVAAWGSSKLGWDPWSFAYSAPGAIVVVILSGAGFATWFLSPKRLQKQGILDSATLSDARHEAAAVPSGGAAVDKLLIGSAEGRISAPMLWGAMGHVAGFNRRWTAILSIVGAAAFFAVHAYRHGRGDSAFFLACSVLAGLMAGWPFFMIQGAWATSALEQSLLVLSPRWPDRRALKWLVIRTLWSQSPTWLIAWTLLAALGLAAGWIGWPVVARGAAGLLCIVSALFGFLLVFLTRRRLKKQNRLAMLYLVVTGIAGLLLIPFQKSAAAWQVLCLMLIIPAALAVLAFCLRRPQFPVRPDADLIL